MISNVDPSPGQPSNPQRSPVAAAAVPTTSSQFDRESLPPLFRDRSFWGMTVTQFLGALNDSIFKQIMLMLCLAVVLRPGGPAGDQQFIAQGIFAVAFVLFSGIAGYWSDRVTKRAIIVGCKLAEIGVMGAACWAFMTMATPQAVTRVSSIGGVQLQSTAYVMQGMPWMLLAVLFLTGTHSAIFGPAKYGILPEMVRGRDLPRFNGVVQMTTFLALIFGIWIGGELVDYYHAALWKASLVCISIAALGTLSSLLVRRTPVAAPGAKFHWSAVAVSPETWRLFRADLPLVMALVVYSIFWFVVALLPMIINWLGVYQFYLSYGTTSLLLAFSSIGIAGGFLLAGWLSGDRVRFGLARAGAWGLFVCLILMGLPRSFTPDAATTAASPAAAAQVEKPADVKASPGAKVEKLAGSRWPHLVGYRGSQVLLVLMGFFAGMFALPVQVFLQSRPPDALKGRVIGTMNLVNWLAIILAVVFYWVADLALAHFGLPKFAIFALAGLTLLPIALFYHPKDAAL